MTATRKFIALDIDGTVILEDESPSAGVIEAVAHAQAQGHTVTLATGRSWESTDRILDLLGITPEYVVCSNGAVVMRREGAEYVRDFVVTFDASDVLALLSEHVPHGKYMVEIGDGRRLFTEDMHDWNVATGRRVTFDELAHEPVCRVVVVSPDESDADFVQRVETMGLHNVAYAVGWSAWLDIAPKGVDKSTGLTRVIDALGVDLTDVIVMGDGRNDIEMFRWAREGNGRAIAMGQAPDEVKDEASEVTDEVLAGGVAAVLITL